MCTRLAHQTQPFCNLAAVTHLSLEQIAALLTPANIATAFIAVNFLAFAAFGIDKAKAEAGT